MFESVIYENRRARLISQLAHLQGGLLLFPGNNNSPMNYADNHYRFRQDSTFLYFWGLDSAGLAATIDLDNGEAVLYGNDLSMDDIVWTGPQPSMQEQAAQVGVSRTEPFKKFTEAITAAISTGRAVHFLPQYRADNIVFLSELLGLQPRGIDAAASVAFIKAVVALRCVKGPEEVAEMEQALDICYDMHTYAMRHARAGVSERDIAGAIEGIALARGNGVSYPVIFSVNGHTLHNHSHENIMQAGQIVVNDSGASSLGHYAGDITRTIPVSGKFTEKQKIIYEIELEAVNSVIAELRPGVKYKDVHMHACRIVAGGLHALGLMQGDVDEAVAAGAHALFMPHGLGHMIGLDVHDMEDLGENYVGYDEETRRGEQFGLSALRLGRAVQTGFTFTVEPGIYFIPELIDLWQSQGKHKQFINYNKVAEYRDFSGLRIEENVVITENGCRILGKPIPKTIADVEDMAAG